MTTPVGGGAPTTTTTAAGGTNPNFRASDLLQNGRFTLNTEQGVGKDYASMLGMLGETSGKAVQKKVEDKMTAWIQAHPNADQAAVDAQLRKTLQVDTMQYKMVQDSINKMMKQIEDKMKEIANDRFG